MFTPTPNCEPHPCNPYLRCRFCGLAGLPWPRNPSRRWWSLAIFVPLGGPCSRQVRSGVETVCSHSQSRAQAGCVRTRVCVCVCVCVCVHSVALELFTHQPRRQGLRPVSSLPGPFSRCPQHPGGAPAWEGRPVSQPSSPFCLS